MARRAMPIVDATGVTLQPTRGNGRGRPLTAQQGEHGHFKKGNRPPGGRPKGSRNHVDNDVKEMMDALVAHGLKGGIAAYDRVVQKAPSRALAVLARFAEYRLPKLARTEVTGPNGGPVMMERRTIEVRHEAAPAGTTQATPEPKPAEEPKS
jgi:hypothetical protein